ncbi:hypothetical protein O181_048325 [Austropuccinia psidii MF-1]|uniref:Uncharacterized protein n=1 Tax=Austropuccinia psidii MF-1 TaxID=1389203 RepID=A0A9Q3DX29_9BASI|nr:hypothetical protein [Austropuccinia psidii MF-1]
MNLDQEIKFIKQKDKNKSPDERHIWRMPHLPQVPKDLNKFQEEAVEIYQSQYKNWFMEEKLQDEELLPSLWIGKMNSYLQEKKFLGPEKAEYLLTGWTPISVKGKVQQIKAWLKSQSLLSEVQKKQLAQNKNNTLVEAPKASTSTN